LAEGAIRLGGTTRDYIQPERVPCSNICAKLGTKYDFWGRDENREGHQNTGSLFFFRIFKYPHKTLSSSFYFQTAPHREAVRCGVFALFASRGGHIL
jgi:hypothetical protein